MWLRWREGERLTIEAADVWRVDDGNALTKELEVFAESVISGERIVIDVGNVERFDSFGIVSLIRFKLMIEARGSVAIVANLAPKYQGLYDDLAEGLAIQLAKPKPKAPLFHSVSTQVGEGVYGAYNDFIALLDILGQVVIAMKRTVLGQTRVHFYALVHQIDRIAFQAVPIVILITFLIGAIIGQQGIFHFRSFGADIFVVDMVGVLTLREIGVLIVSIMIAGRTGSAYTAELGSMKMREEIDAVRVMGLDPIELLVLPRFLAMMIGLPILTIIGDFSALFGGALVAKLYGGIGFDTFFDRFQEVVSVRHLWVGLIKAPFMALIIGLIACVEGLRVRGSAESLGAHTTASVVKSIFLVIVMDGLFAMFFAAMDV
jgi:phospholipid/cholesterol/gamma-HCH transport system permease protein